MTNTAYIAIVDDDESVRESLEGLFKSMAFTVATFDSAESFLSCDTRNVADCLILDVRMPAMTGPELQQVLNAEGCPISIIFISAHGDERLRRRLMQDGAVSCLAKPFSEEALLDAVNLALRK